MQRLLLLLFLTPLFLIGTAKNRSIDSLINNLNNLKVDSIKFNAYITISDAYADNFYDKALIYLNEALILAEKSSERIKVALVYSKIGSLYIKKGELPTALLNYNNALEIHKFLNNKKGIGQVLNDIGLIYKAWGKYDKALDNYLISLRIFDEIVDDFNRLLVLSNIGQIFYYRKEYEKSITYFKKYLDVNYKNKTMRGVAGAANNIASAYLELDKLDKALDYYILSMRIYDSLGIKLGVAIIKDNIGSLYIRKKQYNDALLYNTESSKIFEELGSKSRLCASLHCVGLAYTKLNKRDLAIKYLNRSLEIALNLKQQETKKDIYETFTELYTQTKQYDKALLNYKLFVEIKDSLLSSETISRIETIQAEYESQKKEINLAAINQQLHNQRILGFLSAGISFIFLFITALYIRKNQQKKKTIKIAEIQANQLHQIIGKTNQNLFISHNHSAKSLSIFDDFWYINSSQEICSYIPFYKDSYLIIVFISKGNPSDNEDIIKLSIFDFLNSLNSFNLPIKEQFNNFISKEVIWQNALSKEMPMNIDFWCYNIDTEQQKYSGIISAFHVDNNKSITDLSKTNNTWSKVEKGNRIYFCTSNRLSSFILNEQAFFRNTVSKTIAKTLDLSFIEQKEILSNSLEMIEAGSEQQLGISITGYIL